MNKSFGYEEYYSLIDAMTVRQLRSMIDETMALIETGLSPDILEMVDHARMRLRRKLKKNIRII
jgi:hypothetical protein